MTYPLQENADGVFANRILRPEPEMQAIFTEIGLRTCGHGSFPLPAGLPCRRRQGKKSPATANFLFDAQPNLFGIARQIKKSANFVHGLFAYRLAERRGFEPLKPFRGLLAFQAGQFNHSCTFPRIKKKEPTIRPVDSLRRERDSNNPSNPQYINLLLGNKNQSTPNNPQIICTILPLRRTWLWQRYANFIKRTNNLDHHSHKPGNASNGHFCKTVFELLSLRITGIFRHDLQQNIVRLWSFK